MTNEKKQESFYIVHKDHNDWVLGYKGSSSELFFSPHTAPEMFYSQESIDNIMKKYPWIKEKGVVIPANESLESLDAIKESLDTAYQKFLENVSVNNVNGMGHVSFPGDPSTQNEFPSQGAGSGDIPFPVGASSCGHVYTQKPAMPITLAGQRIPKSGLYESFVGDYTYIGYVYKGKIKSSSHKNYDGDTIESVLNDILKFSEIKKITIGWNESTGSYDVFCSVASSDIEKGKKSEFSYKWKTDTDEELTEYIKKANVYDLEDFINIVYPKIKNRKINIFS